MRASYQENFASWVIRIMAAHKDAIVCSEYLTIRVWLALPSYWIVHVKARVSDYVMSVLISYRLQTASHTA